MFDADNGSLYTAIPPLGTFSSAGSTTGGKGYFGRVQTGFDYQFANNWVAGVFGDYDFSSIKGTMQDNTAGIFFFAGSLGAAPNQMRGARLSG